MTIDIHEEAIELMAKWDQTYRMDNQISLDEYLVEYSVIMHVEDIEAGWNLFYRLKGNKRNILHDRLLNTIHKPSTSTEAKELHSYLVKIYVDQYVREMLTEELENVVEVAEHHKDASMVISHAKHRIEEISRDHFDK